MDSSRTFFEFFAGGGMARLGLGNDWTCTFANEWSDKKAATYQHRFGRRELLVDDVANLTPKMLPGTPTLAWASFPCQDLSLAGDGAGLRGKRSGTFRPFWRLMQQLVDLERQPQIIVLENVVGTLTSHRGADFASIVKSLVTSKYRVGALVIDAVKFVPQSRPRLFIVGVQAQSWVSPSLISSGPQAPWHTQSIRTAFNRLPASLRESWIWWALPGATSTVPPFSSLIEEKPTGVSWHTKAETDHILSLMSPLHRRKVKDAMKLKRRVVGTIYRRTRPNENGKRVQRAEVRFDEIAGCLRTPVGGSSRQTILVVEGGRIRSRLLSPREAARLMGVDPEDYPIPTNYNEAYHLFGDGLAVPVVDWLSSNLLKPLTESAVQVAA
jgi:DNA (cytosine-5)-methyltransferase 1